jgi:hypothetical protein
LFLSDSVQLIYLKEAGSEAEATAGHVKRLFPHPRMFEENQKILGKKNIHQPLKIKIKN